MLKQKYSTIARGVSGSNPVGVYYPIFSDCLLLSGSGRYIRLKHGKKRVNGTFCLHVISLFY